MLLQSLYCSLRRRLTRLSNRDGERIGGIRGKAAVATAAVEGCFVWKQKPVCVGKILLHLYFFLKYSGKIAAPCGGPKVLEMNVACCCCELRLRLPGRQPQTMQKEPTSVLCITIYVGKGETFCSPSQIISSRKRREEKISFSYCSGGGCCCRCCGHGKLLCLREKLLNWLLVVSRGAARVRANIWTSPIVVESVANRNETMLILFARVLKRRSSVSNGLKGIVGPRRRLLLLQRRLIAGIDY